METHYRITKNPVNLLFAVSLSPNIPAVLPISPSVAHRAFMLKPFWHTILNYILFIFGHTLLILGRNVCIKSTHTEWVQIGVNCRLRFQKSLAATFAYCGQATDLKSCFLSLCVCWASQWYFYIHIIQYIHSRSLHNAYSVKYMAIS